MTKASDALKAKSYDKVKAALDSGTEVVSKRIKVIKLADKSDLGWSTVNEYLSDELASNSDDEKRMYRAERRAGRKTKERRRRFRPADHGGSKGIGVFYFYRFFSPFRTFLFSEWSA